MHTPRLNKCSICLHCPRLRSVVVATPLTGLMWMKRLRFGLCPRMRALSQEERPGQRTSPKLVWESRSTSITSSSHQQIIQCTPQECHPARLGLEPVEILQRYHLIATGLETVEDLQQPHPTFLGWRTVAAPQPYHPVSPGMGTAAAHPERRPVSPRSGVTAVLSAATPVT